MDLVVNTKALVTELSFVLSAFKSRDLDHRPAVTFTGGTGRLQMTFDDGQALLKSSVPAEAKFEGLHTLQTPADILLDYLRLVRDKEVRLMASDTRMNVWHDEGSVTVPNLLYVQHPRDILDTLAVSVTIPRKALSELIAAGAFAAVKDAIAKVGGTLLQTAPDLVRIVATNGYIIAEASQSHPVVATQDIVIPPPALEQLRKLLKDAEGDEVVLERREKNFVANCGTRYFAMGVASGPFPMAYGKLFPEDNAHRIVFDGPMLSEAVSRALTVTVDKDPAIDFKFSGTDITIKSATGSETLSAIDGDANLELTINGQFLKSILDNSPAPQMAMTAIDAIKPLVFTPEWPDGQVRYLATTIRKQQ